MVSWVVSTDENLAKYQQHFADISFIGTYGNDIKCRNIA